MEKAQNYVQDGLARFTRKGVITEDAATAAYDRIRWTADMEEFRGAGVVIEVIVEKVEPKKEVFAVLDKLLPPEALILTNTSSISITDLASSTARPDKVCGTHFFTPPPLREAVEVPRGLLTSDETVEKVKALLTSFGKVPVVVQKDVPGFVANRFLMPMLLEACRLLEEGVASKEEIDLLVKKGLGFPIGPFELGDLSGSTWDSTCSPTSTKNSATPTTRRRASSKTSSGPANWATRPAKVSTITSRSAKS